MTTPPSAEGTALPVLDGPTPAAVTEPPTATFARVDETLLAAIRSSGAAKVVLQVPAGLVRDAHALAARIHDGTGVPVVLAVRPCFGACDPPSASESAGAGLAVLLGHAPIPNIRMPLPTFFVEMREPGGDPGRLAQIVHDAGLPARLGVVASVQHLDLVPALVAALAERGHDARTGSGGPRLRYAAQALGCNYTPAEAVASDVDAFVFLGTGRFHPIGLAFAVDRPVYALDPLQGLLDGPIDRAGLVRRRQLLVASVRDARRWGILASTFPGQDRQPMALALKRRAEARGREAQILVFDRLDARDLEGRDLDAYVSTACPRIALDDSALYPRPLLTPPEFLMALGELPLEPYRFDTYH